MTAPVRVTILKEAQRATHGDRDKSYGPPLENFSNAADLIEGYFHARGWITSAKHGAVSAEDVAHILALIKMGRTINPNLAAHRDNYIDGAAYMAIAGELAEEERNA